MAERPWPIKSIEITVACSAIGGRTASQARTLPVKPCSNSSGGPLPDDLDVKVEVVEPHQATGTGTRASACGDDPPDIAMQDHVAGPLRRHFDDLQSRAGQTVRDGRREPGQSSARVKRPP